MATRTIVSLEDDIDGSEAASTVQFSLDQVSYEIDLSTENAERFRETLSPFIEAARTIGSQRHRSTRSPNGTRKSGSRDAASRKNSAEIRAWAKDQGIETYERGRIPARVIEKYEARKK